MYVSSTSTKAKKRYFIQFISRTQHQSQRRVQKPLNFQRISKQYYLSYWVFTTYILHSPSLQSSAFTYLCSCFIFFSFASSQAKATYEQDEIPRGYGHLMPLLLVFLHFTGYSSAVLQVVITCGLLFFHSLKLSHIHYFH